MLHQTPCNLGRANSRWTLGLIAQVCDWLQGYSLSGVWRVLQVLRLHYKRGQQHIHSPDPDYEQKRDAAQACVRAAQEHPDQEVTLYLDEFSFYRWPSLARCFAPAGRRQPLAELTPDFNTRGRLVIALSVADAKTLYRQRAHIDVPQLVGFLHDIRQAYPRPIRINLIQDNWHHVHFHPDQIAAAHAEEIRLLALPTYAPWLNPTEKVGRKLRQEILHMHSDSVDWPGLKQRVSGFLDQFVNGSSDLLRYVGLSPG